MLALVKDFSTRTELQTVIADGKEVYQGHPTTVSLPDGKTLFCTWTAGHGGPCGSLAQSTDGGKTWKRIATPENWKDHVNCPTIWNLNGKLIVYAQEPESRIMVYSLSEDGGRSWTPMRRCGGNIDSVMPWTAILPDRKGRFVALTNARDPGNRDKDCNRVIRSYSVDGVNWSAPEAVTHLPEAKLCEPWVLSSPDGSAWACLMRANNRRCSSMIMFSEDDGQNWSAPLDLPRALKGDRHIARYLPDGRILAVFRCMDETNEYYGDFCGWIGQWSDLKNSFSGGEMFRLLHHIPILARSVGDCGYPGLEILPDASAVATTYLRYRSGDEGNSIVSIKIPLFLMR